MCIIWFAVARYSRRRGDLIYLYQILRGTYDIQDQFFTPPNSTTIEVTLRDYWSEPKWAQYCEVACMVLVLHGTHIVCTKISCEKWKTPHLVVGMVCTSRISFLNKPYTRGHAHGKRWEVEKKKERRTQEMREMKGSIATTGSLFMYG